MLHGNMSKHEHIQEKVSENKTQRNTNKIPANDSAADKENLIPKQVALK